jgi:hypothetical protein
MKWIVLVALLAGGAWLAWGRLAPSAAQPLYEGSYVVVYGRDTCGLTQGMLRELERLDVAYDDQQIDDAAVAEPLHERMDHAGLSTARYMPPVVDVSGRLMVSPDAIDVATAYRLASSSEAEGEP